MPIADCPLPAVFAILCPMTVNFKKIHPAAVLPAYARPGDAGMDVCACEAATLHPGERKLVKTGLVMELPRGTEAQMRPRSGLALKNGITLLNTPGTIDEGYRGEVGIILINLGKETFEVQPGMRIAQMVIAPVLHVATAETAEVSGTVRGTGGFGSTGA
jgi:dUTP pyrophosphatase